MNREKLLQSRWIPAFWFSLALFCALLPDSARHSWGLLAQFWYWLALALICLRWQQLGNAEQTRPSARRRRRPAATRRRHRPTAHPTHSRTG